MKDYAKKDLSNVDADTAREHLGAVSADKVSALATRTEIFTKDGLFRVPKGVTSVRVLLMGGGGGGGTGHNGGGGGGGGYFVEQDVAVTPNRDILITIGAGGTRRNRCGNRLWLGRRDHFVR